MFTVEYPNLNLEIVSIKFVFNTELHRVLPWCKGAFCFYFCVQSNLWSIEKFSIVTGNKGFLPNFLLYDRVICDDFKVSLFGPFIYLFIIADPKM